LAKSREEGGEGTYFKVLTNKRKSNFWLTLCIHLLRRTPNDLSMKVEIRHPPKDNQNQRFLSFYSDKFKANYKHLSTLICVFRLTDKRLMIRLKPPHLGKVNIIYIICSRLGQKMAKFVFRLALFHYVMVGEFPLILGLEWVRMGMVGNKTRKLLEDIILLSVSEKKGVLKREFWAFFSRGM